MIRIILWRVLYWNNISLTFPGGYIIKQVVLCTRFVLLSGYTCYNIVTRVWLNLLRKPSSTGHFYCIILCILHCRRLHINILCSCVHFRVVLKFICTRISHIHIHIYMNIGRRGENNRNGRKKRVYIGIKDTRPLLWNLILYRLTHRANDGVSFPLKSGGHIIYNFINPRDWKQIDFNNIISERRRRQKVSPPSNQSKKKIVLSPSDGLEL